MEYEELLKNIEKCTTNKGRAKLNVEDIVEIKPFTTQNQTEPLFHVKQRVKHSSCSYGGVTGNTYRMLYDIVNSAGEVLAWVNVYTKIISNTSAEIEYQVAPELAGKGIATTLLAEVTEDVFKNNALDGFVAESQDGVDKKKTKIDKLFLVINEDNYASKRVAEKNGYILNKADGSYELTAQQYMEKNGFQPT